MGRTGLEPVTPALSRRCSNQLSYRPAVTDFLHKLITRTYGGKETRTPDIKLAKLALYQLSYTPKLNARETKKPMCALLNFINLIERR